MKVPRLIEGDCLVELPKLAAAGVHYHAVITDPPYHLTTNKPGGTGIASLNVNSPAGRSRIGTGFMGKAWDGGDIAFRPETWRAVYDVLLPGGYMVCFASTRGYHRMVCAIEDAGFVIHPMICWLFGTGFPKATDVSRGIDKAAGAEREVVGPRLGRPGCSASGTNLGQGFARAYEGRDDRPAPALDITAPATPEALQWEGWKYGLQSLKPSIEPICLAQKPSEKGGMIPNILKHGTGALNIDATRVPANGEKTGSNGACGLSPEKGWNANSMSRDVTQEQRTDQGRWPANVVHDGNVEVESAFATFGSSTSPQPRLTKRSPDSGNRTGYGTFGGQSEVVIGTGDTGTASRFFTQCPFTEDELRFHYSGKANKTVDRAESSHPTIKPISLLKWLVTLITPPGGHVCDPFAGSGGVAEACMLLGFDCTLIERDAAYAEDIRHRIKRWSGLDTPLFAEPTS